MHKHLPEFTEKRGFRFACTIFLILSVFLVNITFGSTVKGKVVDKDTKAPLINVNVVLDNTDYGAATDLKGNYVILGIQPGVYAVTVSSIGYEPFTRQDIVIYDDQEMVFNFSLSSEAVKLEETEVVGTAKKGTEERELEERFKAMSITDALAGEELKRMPDPDVSSVVKRATGVSTMGGEPSIRGLGLRYSKVTMNGSSLSGTEPNKSGVSLELFPSSMMSRVTVKKSYMVDQFGEFGGGIINMSTWEIPQSASISISASFGYSPKSTFKDAYTYEGSEYDWLGFDDGTRDIPSQVEAAGSIPKQTRFTEGYTPGEIEELGQAFPNNWATQTKTAMPSQSYNFSYTNGFKLFGCNMGMLLSGLYKLSDSFKEINKKVIVAGNEVEPVINKDFDMEYYKQGVTLGGLFALQYELSKLHRLNLNAFINREAEDETRFYSGYHHEFDYVEDTRLRFLTETISSVQFSGQHLFPRVRQSNLDWQLTYSRGLRYEPDLREAQYERQGDEELVLSDETQSGSRQFSDLTDNTMQGNLNWSSMITPSFRLKTGYTFLNRSRESQTVFYQFDHRDNFEGDKTLPLDQIFNPDNIGSQGFELRNATRETDAYDASQTIHATFFIADLKPLPYLRFIGGVRYEQSIQKLETAVLYTADYTPITAEIDQGDFLPAVNLIYELKKDMNLRLAYSQTVSRPDFREMSPYEFTDIVGGYAVKGDTTLTRTLIKHIDLRYEWMHGTTNLFSFSVFYKKFENPIEFVINPNAALQLKYENSESADNYGFEFEMKQKLGDFHPRLSPWAITTNLTLLKSEIRLDEDSKSVQTDPDRPMQGQSPYLFNFGVYYTAPRLKTNANLFFHVFGKRITEVGALGLDNVYELPHPDLDLVVSQPLNERFSMKVSWKNILDSEVKFQQGEEYTERYRVGSTYSIGFSYRN